MTRSLREWLKEKMSERHIRRNRLVTKDGHFNFDFGNVMHRNRFAYVQDFWTTFLETRWRFIIVYYVASFTLSWFIFSLFWYWSARNHGDLLWQNPPSNYTQCVYSLNSLTYAFLFSIKTQGTIGYGNVYPTDACAQTVALIVIQLLIGSINSCFWCGIVMTKITHPKKRAKTITFSESAIICPKEGNLCLQIRVANLRKTLMIGSQIYGRLLLKNITPEGDTVILDQVSIEFMVDAGKDNLFFVCPLTLYHVIDKTSPLYDMAVDTLHQQDFELVVFLEGTAESTSSSCQVRTSYIPQEILWGYDFMPIISRNKEGRYCVDFSNITKVVPVPTAHCAHCYHNEPGHHHHSISAVINQAFEAIDNEPARS